MTGRSSRRGAGPAEGGRHLNVLDGCGRFGGKLIPTASTFSSSMKLSDRRPTGFRLRMSGWSIWRRHTAADTSRWHLVVRDHITHNAARAYLKPTDDRAALEGHLTFYWDKMDAWFEEDEQVFVHPRDPYTRVDTVHSSRHVRVVIDGVTLGETRRPILLFETGLPTRYYIPKLDVCMDLLEPSEYVTSCPYKGVARHWSARWATSRQGHRVELSGANSRVPED